MPRDEDARPALTLERSPTRQARRRRRVAIAGAALVLVAATGPGTARVATAALPLEYNLSAPGLQQSVGGILPVLAGGLYFETLLYLTAALAVEGCAGLRDPGTALAAAKAPTSCAARAVTTMCAPTTAPPIRSSTAAPEATRR